MSGVTLTNIARFTYVQYFGLAVFVYFYPHVFYNVVVGHAPPVADYESFFTYLFMLYFVHLGCMFAAVAQYSSVAAQRKVFQYSMGGYMALAATQGVHNQEKAMYVVGFCALNLIISIYAVYVLYVKEKLSVDKANRDSGALKWSLRATYIWICLQGCVNYFELVPAVNVRSFKDPAGLAQNLYYTRLFNSVRLIAALALVGAAQLSNADMKKTVQYCMPHVIMDCIVLTNHIDIFTEAGAQVNVLNVILITLYTYACYPASCAKTTIRLLYFSYFSSAYFCLTKTRQYIHQTMPKLGVSTGVESMGKVYGLQLLMLALLFVAAAQCDETVHRKILQYTVGGYICLFFGLDHFLRICDTPTLFSSITLIGVLYHKQLGLNSLNIGNMFSKKSGSPPNTPKKTPPKRSNTPTSSMKKKTK